MSDLKKITGDKDEITELWADRIQRGINRREEEEKGWDLSEQFEDLKQWGSISGLAKGEGDEATINKFGAFLRSYNAEVAFNDPRFKLTPKTADGWEEIQVPVAGPGGSPKLDEQGQVVVKGVIPARAREALLNEILTSPMHNTQLTSRLLTKSGIIAQGYLKSTYNPIYETAQKKEGDQVIPIVNGKLDTSQFAKNKFDGSLIEDDDERLITRSQIPIWEDFSIRWVPYRNMILDPDGGAYLEDHSWIAEEQTRSLKAVKDDPLFKNTEDLKASGERESGPKNTSDPEGSDWSAPSKERRDSDRKIVRLIHIYDQDNERYYVMADGHGKFLRDVSWTELKIGCPPYSDFRPSLGTTDSPYQRPLGNDLAPICQLINTLYQNIVRQAQHSTRKGFYRKGKLDASQIEQLTNNVDMEWIPLDIPERRAMTDFILPYTPPPVNNAIYQALQGAERAFQEVSGMTDPQMGKSSADSATEASHVEKYSGSRIAHDRKILAECWRRAGKIANDSLDANMTKERAVQVIGTDGETFSALVDPDMIMGDFDVSVDFEDMAPVNSAMQNQGKIQMLQIAGQAPEYFMDESLVRGWLEPYGIKDQKFVDAMVQSAQMKMQLLMMQAQGQGAAPGPVPEAGAPTSEHQAISQSGAGTQSPRMSSAT